jgi:O-antigen/teichoic acid export membrane protein
MWATVNYLRQQWMTQGSFSQQVASTFFVQSLTLGIALVNGAIIARSLGTEGKGLVQLSMLIPAMLNLFLSGGLGVANVYFSGKQLLPINAISRTSVTYVILATGIGFLLAVLVFMMGWVKTFLPGVSTTLYILALLGLPLELLRNFLLSILQGLRKIKWLNKISVLYALTLLLSTLILVVVLPLGLSGAVIAYLFASFIGCLLAIYHLRFVGGEFVPRWEWSEVKSLLSYGLRGYVGNLLQFYNYRLDNFIVNYYMGSSAVGIYSIAVRLAELLWRFPDAVGFVIFPKAAATEALAMNRFTPRIFRLTLVITLVGGLGLALVGRPFIIMIYGTAFASAFYPLLWLLPGVVLLGAAKVLTNEIAGRGFPHYNSLNSGLALLLTVIFDLLLIPNWGITGAAAASSIAYGAIFVTSLLAYWRVSRQAALT